MMPCKYLITLKPVSDLTSVPSGTLQNHLVGPPKNTSPFCVDSSRWFCETVVCRPIDKRQSRHHSAN